MKDDGATDLEQATQVSDDIGDMFADAGRRDDALNRASEKQHRNLPRRFVPSLVNTFSVFGAVCISWGSVFTGSDIATEALASSIETLERFYGAQFTFEQKFMCENDKDKQSFLKETNARCGLLIGNASEMTNMVDGPTVAPRNDSPKGSQKE